MFANWFGTKEVDDFADSLVAELVRRLPPSLEATPKKIVEKISKTQGALCARADEFVSSRRLSIYQKARLGNRFKWALKDAGYPPKFVEGWTHELVTRVTLKSRGVKAKDR